MAILVNDAYEIVTAVEDDPKSRRILNSVLKVIPDSFGLTGAIRNWALLLTGQDPSEPKVHDEVCVGIAETTADAINRAIRHGKISSVATATTVDRAHWKTAHTATLIRMKDGSEYVFDWHATLNIHDPMISTKSDWVNASSSTMYVNFTGWP